MPREDTQFKKGNQLGKVNGGRPKKPEWLKGKSEDALKVCYEIMQNEDEKSTDRLAAARIIIEHDLGKPAQQLQVEAEIGEETRKALEERMTLDDAKGIVEAFRG